MVAHILAALFMAGLAVVCVWVDPGCLRPSDPPPNPIMAFIWMVYIELFFAWLIRIHLSNFRHGR